MEWNKKIIKYISKNILSNKKLDYDVIAIHLNNDNNKVFIVYAYENDLMRIDTIVNTEMPYIITIDIDNIKEDELNHIKECELDDECILSHIPIKIIKA